MDADTLGMLAHAAHLDAWLPVVTAIVTLASALNMVLPQPEAGSHWLPLRKLLNLAALARGNAKPEADQPFVTWLQRVLMQLAASLPPQSMPQPQVQAQPAPAPQRVEPLFPPQPAVAPPPAPAPAAPPAPAAAPVPVLGVGDPPAAPRAA